MQLTSTGKSSMQYYPNIVEYKSKHMTTTILRATNCILFHDSMGVDVQGGRRTEGHMPIIGVTSYYMYSTPVK